MPINQVNFGEAAKRAQQTIMMNINFGEAERRAMYRRGPG